MIENIEIKKWYLLDRDQHQGPYSQRELNEKVNQIQNRSDLLIWTDGMKDWEPAENLEKLLLLFHKSPQSQIQTLDFLHPLELQNPQKLQKVNNFDLTPPPEPESEKSKKSLSPSTFSKMKSDPFASDLPDLNNLILLKFKGLFRITLRRFQIFFYSHKIKILTLTPLGLYAAWYYLFLYSSLNEENLNERNKQIILSTLKSRINPSQPLVNIIVMNQENNKPYFYIATNLPPQSKIKLYVEGLPESLVDQFYFRMYSDFTLQEGWIKTPTLSRNQGKPISPGEYRLTLYCDDCPGLSLRPDQSIFDQTYFLGGPKNQTYDQSIKIYHAQLNKQSQHELIETKQIAETLEKQLNDTIAEFDSIIRSSAAFSSNKGREWKSFHQRWIHLQDQLDILYNSWTQEILTEKIFHGSIYSKLQTIAKEIRAIHLNQSNYISAAIRDEGREYQIANDISVVQTSLQNLRIKINLTERLPLSANGMPQRLTGM